MFCFRSILQIWIILIGFRDTNYFMNFGICKHEFKFTCRGYCRFTLNSQDVMVSDAEMYGAPIVSLFYMLNICSIYAEYSFYISNICSVFQMFVPYFEYLSKISNIYSQFEIFVQYPKNMCYISNICSVLKWLYSLPSLFCTSISALCFKYSFCISNIGSD